MKDRDKCKHKKAYSFHDNAPRYCPTCNSYIDGENVYPASDELEKEIDSNLPRYKK